jgi:hypothetical protein
MWTLHTANEGHWVSMDTIVSFKRMREFQSRGVPWVANVLRTSAELEVSEDATKVRRRTEVQEPKGAFERSVYAVRFLFKGLLVSSLVTNHAHRKASVKSFRVFNKNSSDSLPNTEKWRQSVCGASMAPRHSRYILPVYPSSLRISDFT